MRLEVYGCKGRGAVGDAPLDHATGKGWIKRRPGQYHDALTKRKAAVYVMLFEASGAASPHTRAVMRRLHRRADKKNGGRDDTEYGETRCSTKSFYVHHEQRISLAVALQSSRCIHKQLGFLKRRVHQHAVGASGAGAQ